MTPEEIEMMKEEQKQEQESGFGRWNWFGMIEKLAKGDITKFDDIYKQNFILCLNLLSFWSERDAMQAKLEKQQN